MFGARNSCSSEEISCLGSMPVLLLCKCSECCGSSTSEAPGLPIPQSNQNGPCKTKAIRRVMHSDQRADALGDRMLGVKITRA